MSEYLAGYVLYFRDGGEPEEQVLHRGSLESCEQLLDLLETHAMTHVGLLSERPPRLFVANVAELAARGATLRLAVILRSGREAAARTDQTHSPLSATSS